MLDPGVVGIGGREMEVDLHRKMRRHLEVLLLGHRRDLQKLRDAADPRRIGLDEVHRIVGDQREMLGHAGQHFA